MPEAMIHFRALGDALSIRGGAIEAGTLVGTSGVGADSVVRSLGTRNRTSFPHHRHVTSIPGTGARHVRQRAGGASCSTIIAAGPRIAPRPIHSQRDRSRRAARRPAAPPNDCLFYT